MKKKIITASFAMMLFVTSADVTYVHDPGLRTLTATVAVGDAEFNDAASLALLTGNSVTNFVKAGAGRLIVPYDVNISSYVGEIRVAEGVYRYQHVKGLGKNERRSRFVGGSGKWSPVGVVSERGINRHGRFHYRNVQEVPHRRRRPGWIGCASFQPTHGS